MWMLEYCYIVAKGFWVLLVGSLLVQVKRAQPYLQHDSPQNAIWFEVPLALETTTKTRQLTVLWMKGP